MAFLTARQSMVQESKASATVEPQTTTPWCRWSPHFSWAFQLNNCNTYITLYKTVSKRSRFCLKLWANGNIYYYNYLPMYTVYTYVYTNICMYVDVLLKCNVQTYKCIICTPNWVAPRRLFCHCIKHDEAILLWSGQITLFCLTSDHLGSCPNISYRQWCRV